ncbi:MULTISPECIES: alpha/beta hydrolase-fold protein [unclassified Streptomyces]|uniref:alpha/beta hydrolase family esterase n=1 Tax=unclassified Streptomyces TaxID=2593676 RepID=UPI00081ECE34|nr:MULTISPECIES: alpha/beta hydrolase-fold protein [unclassified Streptomyces]MYZ35169.1 poly(3-hydroxybutyrate) depolymerase [Streptomyces sp. SID4917]SCF73298.1 polyhydroxybutyrate depolymerase [Streptomyces sp. MnatMP-M17]
MNSLQRMATAAVSLVLCVGATGTATAAVPTAATASKPSKPSKPSKSACRLPAPQQPGTSASRTISSGGRDRTYQLHLPDNYAEKRDWPLVLAFHGRGNTGAGTEEFSKLSTLPAVVVYPDGVIGTGDGDRQAWQGAPYAAAGVDDVRFTEDLLDRLEATLCVDERRVYATGKSNGAGFVGTLLACHAADRIAAIAPVAAALYPTGEKCEPSRPVPVIEFHGTGDATIPYAGDADRGLPAIQDWVADWADRNGCDARARDSVIGSDVTVSRWRGCDRGAEVRHVAVTDGGHTWPGADSYSGGGYTTQTIEAHEVMWQFLRQFRTPASHRSPASHR